jgi:hypothetical protein
MFISRIAPNRGRWDAWYGRFAGAQAGEMHARARKAAGFRALAAVLVLLGLVAEVRGQGGQPIPPMQYFNGMPLLFDGNFGPALASFVLMQQQAIKNPLVVAGGGNWIDSICYQAMQGECNYQMGNHAAALANFQFALSLYAIHSDWMTSVQFSPLIRPANPGQVLICPWYISQRGAGIGQYPPSVPIMQGRINNNQQVFQGGVVQMAMMVPINPQEIARCTCLALRRWRELLGPTCKGHPVTQSVLNALVRRPALPNHWSQAYVDVELGLAYAAAEKPQQAAKALEAGLVAGGLFDHQLTCIALLELGRLAVIGGNLAGAQTYFMEASASACNFGDIILVEEALRYGFFTHIISNGQGVYLPLAAATTWAAAQGLTQLQTSLLVMAAENSCAFEQPQAAMAFLGTATTVSARTNIPMSKLGARLNYAKALAFYEMMDLDDGDLAMAAAMTYQRVGSLWLFHIGLVDMMWQAQELTDRTAMDLFEYVLRDPTPTDWATDPLESLSVLVAPHPLVFEHWFEVAMTRKEHERALEIADLARRHRFLSTLDFGGRLLNLRWVLEGPASLLDQDAVQQRGALLARYVGYDERSKKAKQLQVELRQMPLVAADKDAALLQTAKLEELAKLSLEQEVILREMALRREPCNLVFPPVRSTKQVQEALPKGHGLLAFFSTARQSYAFLMTKEKYGYWQIKGSPKTFVNRLQSMLQKWGNYEQNKEVKAEELADDRWKAPAKEILDMLTGGSKADLGGGAFEELAIVPDGLLWYVPFEALQIPDGDRTQPLIAKLRIRYAPTVGLAMGDPHRRRRGANTAVVLGRLYPRDDPEVAAEAFEDLSRAAPGAVAIQDRLPAASAIYSTLFDRLVVYSEVAPADANPYAWSPVPLDRGKPGSALASWFPLPWGGPDEIILPGFRTSAEHAAKGLSPDEAARELFLSTCGLMSTGARTVLISRWRLGGRTSYDLVREFVQELPDTTASNAWQRSVELVSRLPLEPGSEPRFKADSQRSPPAADNPFFWAGYMLVDTGSSPRSSDEEPAQDEALVLKAVPAPAGQQAAGDPAAEMKPGQEAKPGAGKAGVDVAAGGGGLGLRQRPNPINQRPLLPKQAADQNPADVQEPEGPPAEAQPQDPPAAEPAPVGKGKRQPRVKPDRKKPPVKPKRAKVP